MHKIVYISGCFLFQPGGISCGPLAFLAFSELKMLRIVFLEISKLVKLGFLILKSSMLNEN